MYDNNQNSLKLLLSYIRNTTWSSLDATVQEQAKKCFLDLAGVTCAGAKNNSAVKVARYVMDNIANGGKCTILRGGYIFDRCCPC